MFLHGVSQTSLPRASTDYMQKAPTEKKYHWQAEDFGMEDIGEQTA